MDYKKLAEMLFPDAKPTEYWEEKYKPRNLNANAEVTRFAPSPTGYMHIGHFFGANLDYRIAKSTDGGIFFFRLEDTDKKREVEGSDIVALKTLKHFGIVPDEGFTIDRTNNGEYGPYRQSDRGEIYKSYAKKLVSIGRAFPCFCEKPEGKEEILERREQQYKEEEQTEEYDQCRDLSLEEIEKNLKAGKSYCIRLKCKNKLGDKIKVYDVVRGERELGANTKDVVLIKNNGIPPYTFAHPIDDHLMGTTTVVRGEEWISTWPQHIEIFEALGFKPTKYIHTPLLCKIGENGNKRKISKSKDPEADMRFYIQTGLPKEAVTEYLLNLMNSNFEIWREQNPDKSNLEFPFSTQKIGTSSPFFDMVKLEDVSKNVICKMTAEEVYDNLVAWLNDLDLDFIEDKKDLFNITINFDLEKFKKYVKDNKQYIIDVLSIDRYTPKPRKDIAKFSKIPVDYDYMFGLFNPKTIKDYELDGIKADAGEMTAFLKDYMLVYDDKDEKDVWFNKIKEVAQKHNFATDNKLYKQNPDAYVGNTADACAIIRIAVTGRKNSPDLYSIAKVLKKDVVLQKINQFIGFLG